MDKKNMDALHSAQVFGELLGAVLEIVKQKNDEILKENPLAAAPEQLNHLTVEEEENIIKKQMMIGKYDTDQFIDDVDKILNHREVLNDFQTKVGACESFIQNHPTFLSRLSAPVYEKLIRTCNEQSELNEDKIASWESILGFLKTFTDAVVDFKQIAVHSRNYYNQLKDTTIKLNDK